MYKLSRYIITAAILLLGVSISPVAASSPPLDVKIVATVTFNPDGPNFGSFVATGAAADAGLICPEGTFVDVSYAFGGEQSDRTLIIHITRMFSCNDGSGEFYMQDVGQADLISSTRTSHWVILSGVGAYDKLHGNGNGEENNINSEQGNIATYTGQVLND
jgi:hypothetical protein